MLIRGAARDFRRQDGAFKSLETKALSAIRSLGGSAWFVPRAALGSGNPNLLSSPEYFSSAPWVKAGCTVAAGSVFAPDGSSMTLLTESATSGAHYVLQNATSDVGRVTMSWVVKPNGRNLIKVRSESPQTGNLTASFTLIGAGTVSGPGTIKALDGGLYYITATSTSNGNMAAGYHLIQTLNSNGDESYTGDGVSGVYIWGAKLEQSATATEYTPQSILRQQGVFLDNLGASPVTNVGATIGRINDRVGSNHATQATAANRPLVSAPASGKLAMAFDASNDALTFGFPSTALSVRTYTTTGTITTVTSSTSAQFVLGQALMASRNAVLIVAIPSGSFSAGNIALLDQFALSIGATL